MSNRENQSQGNNKTTKIITDWADTPEASPAFRRLMLLLLTNKNERSVEKKEGLSNN